ncbi:homoserine kinase [Paraurantiacibacter namhicola]|uniref:Homoserine kinase n=1 Tax=Paraurantiacibacter namhicola TaxID=645517 RepID=A0A1C7DB39_9SPHN|nr:homoserine kinase [Paraurantiacibacter namhicola]ANU08592.1 Homoserine kinase [Paraurantiacibacter namhicola]
MAVYTHLTTEEIGQLLQHYDVGELRSAKGIAEGVSNSNWIVETTAARFILTIYEERTEREGLPFFLGLLDHLSAKGSPVPRTIHDRDGAAFREVRGKPVALIEYLPGVSLSHPDAAQAEAVGRALAQLHLDAADFAGRRANTLGPAQWQDMLHDCGDAQLAAIDAALAEAVERHLAPIVREWPQGLPSGIIHADLFPDNVLTLGQDVTGLIDFYFACDGMYAYDLAVTHAAWSFDAHGEYRAQIGAALLAGYHAVRPVSEEERAALPLLARGAAMRFIATRAHDWIHTPPDALVVRKDPMDFVRRLEFYTACGEDVFTLRDQA